MANPETEIDSYSELRDNARKVMQNPAFLEWKRLVEAQVEGRKNEILKPVDSQDALVGQEYMKGEAVGMLQALGMWPLMIEGFEIEIQRRIDENTQDQEK